MLRCVAVFALSVCMLDATAQPRCQGPGYDDFDFWVGEWTVTWTAKDGSTSQGSNRIRRTHDGCVILEEFDGAPGTPLVGTSVSTWDAKRKTWRQTWVDNQASYLDFEGGAVEGGGATRLILSRRAEVNGQSVRQRMVFSDVSADSLLWDWQRSRDDGATWESLWTLRYARRAARSP